MSWYFQFTPHDVHDWDAIQIPVLADIELDGEARKAMLWANRNGFYYTLDRGTGEFLLGKAFAHQTWAEGLDPNGRAHPAAEHVSQPDRHPRRPDRGRRHQLVVAGLQPAHRAAVRQRVRRRARFFIRDQEYVEGDTYTGGGTETPLPIDHYLSAIRAIDPTSGDIRWEFPMTPRSRAGVLRRPATSCSAPASTGTSTRSTPRAGPPCGRSPWGAPCTPRR